MLPSVLVSEIPAQAPHGLPGRDEQELHQPAAEEDRQGPGEVHDEAGCRHGVAQDELHHRFHEGCGQALDIGGDQGAPLRLPAG